MENRKQFLEEVKTKFQIKKPSDWGKLSTQQFIKAGGATLLTKYYDDSLFKCLQSVYDGIFLKITYRRY